MIHLFTFSTQYDIAGVNAVKVFMDGTIVQPHIDLRGDVNTRFLLSSSSVIWILHLEQLSYLPLTLIEYDIGKNIYVPFKTFKSNLYSMTAETLSKEILAIVLIYITFNLYIIITAPSSPNYYRKNTTCIQKKCYYFYTLY